MKIRSFIFVPLMLMLLLNGCVLFTSHYDATRHENFTKLKAMHFKLFDDWSVGSDKTWVESEVSAYCDRGDLSFREAFEYAKSKDDSDKTGQEAVEILWEEFTANCEFSLKKRKLFSQAFLKELTPEIELNYNYAIAGELSRVGAR